MAMSQNSSASIGSVPPNDGPPSLRQANAQIAVLEISRSSGSVNELLKTIEDRITDHITETQSVLRKALGFYGGGFAIATALVIYFMKK
ncbi:unnamed protein product [Eruca vesicaria subsp. sativa]|uniref:t-SNARE coiled-coil homology domain-containing protein n=1 Tax=Eruca vesicaria subsp. sativa TaxID=29727 RepID=A0ABC8K3X3_ERUVS|nr:unnamed protein product [Eruca vesicaria subsp. sativa]